jgi:hypothetical protein
LSTTRGARWTGRTTWSAGCSPSGYPTEDRGVQEAALSVEHSAVLDRYRHAHEISALNNNGKATTDQLRQATVDYRSLVEQLLGTDGGREQREGR